MAKKLTLISAIAVAVLVQLYGYVGTVTARQLADDSQYSSDINSCTDDTLLAHPTNCNAFLQCVHGFLTEKLCPDNLHFNELAQWCDYPENVNCVIVPKEETTVMTFTTEPTITKPQPGKPDRTEIACNFNINVFTEFAQGCRHEFSTGTGYGYLKFFPLNAMAETNADGTMEVKILVRAGQDAHIQLSPDNTWHPLANPPIEIGKMTLQ